jgi:hypothetical protein
MLILSDIMPGATADKIGITSNYISWTWLKHAGDFTIIEKLHHIEVCQVKDYNF